MTSSFYPEDMRSRTSSFQNIGPPRLVIILSFPIALAAPKPPRDPPVPGSLALQAELGRADAVYCGHFFDINVKLLSPCSWAQPCPPLPSGAGMALGRISGIDGYGVGTHLPWHLRCHCLCCSSASGAPFPPGMCPGCRCSLCRGLGPRLLPQLPEPWQPWPMDQQG